MNYNLQNLLTNLQSNKILSSALTKEYQFLLHSTATFFNYILIPRDGYITVSEESINSKHISKPRLTETMVRYVVRNIIGINTYIDTQFDFRADLESIFNRPDTLVNFSKQLSKDTQKIIKEVYSQEELGEIISNGAYAEIYDYLNLIMNRFVDSTEINEEQIEENINVWFSKEGDNVANPIDYGFSHDVNNELLQSFIWVLCGLTDWLEKDTIKSDDIIYACKILFYGHADFYENVLKKQTHKNTNEYIVTYDIIAGSLYKNDFFASPTSIDRLTSVFINLMNADSDEEVSSQYKVPVIYQNLLEFSKKI